LEEAFWRLAAERGAIERNRKGKWVTTTRIGGQAQPVHGVEALVSFPELDLDEDLVRFLKLLAYGTKGNEFRHGTAETGWRLRAMFLIAALLGWLDAIGLLASRRAVRAAFARQHAAQRARHDAIDSGVTTAEAA
jgi:hypothetical protein